jgi:G3E family GTPase
MKSTEEGLSHTMVEKTPIALITGSLGSGKTTLLIRILDETDKKIAVLMNEFGEIAIDSEVIEGENIQLVELAGGCVCCSLTGEFEAAIEEILEIISPELIVVEATGVAEADALVLEVEDNVPAVRLDSVICIVDCYTSVRYPQVGYTARTHLQAADIVLLNKADLVTTEETDGVVDQVRTYNNRAKIFKTVKCGVDVDLLFGMSADTRKDFSVTHGDEHFTSFAFTTDRILDRHTFEEAITDLPMSVYRAKGFVQFREGSYHFNYVIGRLDLDRFSTRGTRLVFIGKDLETVKDYILANLRRCEV